MDLFLIMRLYNRAFCLERREQRVDQFREEISLIEGSAQHFLHNVAASLWTDSNLSERVVDAWYKTLLQ